MTHVQYACNNNEPNCYISVNKNRIKQKNGIVYLNNGTEFEIEFHNLSSDIQKAVITINGKRQQHALVLRPGEHFYLDRFMDDKKRLLFDVYTVDDVAEVRKAIENNGNIKIEFYKERPFVPTYTYPITYTTTYPTWTSGGCFSNNVTSGIHNLSRNFSKTRARSAGINNITKGMELNFLDAEMSVTPQIETGRVEQGSQSNQDFRTVNYDFEYYPHKTVEFKMLPISQQKNVTTNQMRSYCICGRRIKKGWNVCPGCGQNLRSV